MGRYFIFLLALDRIGTIPVLSPRFSQRSYNIVPTRCLLLFFPSPPSSSKLGIKKPGDVPPRLFQEQRPHAPSPLCGRPLFLLNLAAGLYPEPFRPGFSLTMVKCPPEIQTINRGGLRKYFHPPPSAGKFFRGRNAKTAMELPLIFVGCHRCGRRQFGLLSLILATTSRPPLDGSSSASSGLSSPASANSFFPSPPPKTVTSDKELHSQDSMLHSIRHPSSAPQWSTTSPPSRRRLNSSPFPKK